jgi:hypothetical protein
VAADRRAAMVYVEDDDPEAVGVEDDDPEPMPLACLPTASLAALLRGRGVRIESCSERHTLVRAASARWVTLGARWVTLRARWVTLRARWVTLGARWVTLRARWVTLRARWVTLRARWVTLRARWVTLRARWVMTATAYRGLCSSSLAQRVRSIASLTPPPAPPQLAQFNQLLASALKTTWVVDHAPISAQGPPRCWCSAAVQPDSHRVYVYGGRSLGKYGEDACGELFHWSATADFFAARWELFKVRVGPPACWAAAVVVHNNTLYAFGGQTYEKRTNSLFTLELKPAESVRAGPPSWKKATTKGQYPAQRSGHALALLEGDGKADSAQLMLFGGVDGDGDALNDLHVRTSAMQCKAHVFALT